jgi:phosphatidylglycerophosphate synthase
LNADPAELLLVGHNVTRLWGMSVDERVRRIARKQNIPVAEQMPETGPVLLVNRKFVFDPPWLREIAGRPATALTLGGEPAIAHVVDREQRELVSRAMQGESVDLANSGLNFAAHEAGATLVNAELRKREQPFLLPLNPATVRAAERASYFGAYKGVTDLLTKYLWPEWALVLTRVAAALGITPNMVTMLGATLCVAATLLFWHGYYWIGMATGLGFMVLDTVDGKLARCTITSSKLGNVLDHGLDLVHPPFWWWAWEVGLTPYGRPLEPYVAYLVLIVIIAGYVVQRVIEGIFMRRFGMHIHVWRRIDSRFRLITARRNPNMVILFACMLVARPDWGLVALAWWTVLSCLFHLVRLVQAMVLRARGGAIRSWLD